MALICSLRPSINRMVRSHGHKLSIGRPIQQIIRHIQRQDRFDAYETIGEPKPPIARDQCGPGAA